MCAQSQPYFDNHHWHWLDHDREFHGEDSSGNSDPTHPFHIPAIGHPDGHGTRLLVEAGPIFRIYLVDECGDLTLEKLKEEREEEEEQNLSSSS